MKLLKIVREDFLHLTCCLANICWGTYLPLRTNYFWKIIALKSKIYQIVKAPNKLLARIFIVRRGICLTLNISSRNNLVAIKKNLWEFLKTLHFPCWDTYGNYAPLLKVKLIRQIHYNQRHLIFKYISSGCTIHTNDFACLVFISFFFLLY